MNTNLAAGLSGGSSAGDELAEIPLVDLRWQHAVVSDEVRAGFDRVIAGTDFILGEEVSRFEAAFARFCGVATCVGVANGTDALELALRAVGIGPGDEVILPTNTYVATAEAVVRVGAVPVLVDCGPADHLIDPAAVAAAITERTAAIMPVHLYGDLAPMDEVCALAARNGLAVIEDAAQAQGACRDGRRAGSFGDAGGTSFYPGKNLGAYGDAGAVLTGSPETAATVRILRNHGQAGTHDHQMIGCNSRLDSLQAVVLSAKLAHLDEWNADRRRAADRYGELLADVEDVALPTPAPGEPVWHLYVVEVAHRNEVLARLRRVGVQAGIHYPTPIHLMPAWEVLGYRPGAFPVAERKAGRILSLPLFPGISPDQQARVVAELATAVTA